MPLTPTDTHVRRDKMNRRSILSVSATIALPRECLLPHRERMLWTGRVPNIFRRRARLCSYDEIAQSLARIEHALLHGRFRNGENLGDFTHRFLVIIDEVYDLTVRGRQARHALAKKAAFLFTRILH